MKFPLTGDITNDFVVIVIAIITGVALALKAGIKWGWVIVAAAAIWAFKLVPMISQHR